VCLTAANVASAQDILPQVRAMQEDAELTDVAFVDAEHGWAVGDRGTIWHTDDGGKAWRLQPTEVNCRLSSVHFIDAQQGFAVGGMTQPYTHASGGVLLVTRDGGATWRFDRSLMLPALRQVRFFDAASGWAIGEPSATFPMGVFVTENGGRSWSPLAGASTQGWLAGDFLDPHTGALAGRRGALAAVRRRSIEPSVTPELGLRGLRKMKLTKPTGGWLVGDGGLVLTTADTGHSWTMPDGDPHVAAGADFDWRALEVRGSNVWIAGAPGTRILHSSDNGKSWQSIPTGTYAPLHDLCFVDEQHGWAVGSMGVILATTDGGRTWQRQRAGGGRAAILALLAEPQTAPLEMFAKLSGNEGYLSVVEFLNRRDLEAVQPAHDTLDSRAQAALSAVGASVVEQAWSFPLRQAGLSLSADQILDGWNRANDGQATDRLEAHIIRQIRLWRPEVIVTHATNPRGNDPLGHLINQIVLRAVDRASDGTRYPEQLAQQGLEPWRVKKVLGVLADGHAGQLNITTSQLAPRMACSLAELGDQGRSLLSNEYSVAPATIGFQVTVDSLPQGAGSHDFMSGIALYPGSDARRLLVEAPEAGAELIRRVAQKHRNVQAILARPESALADRRALSAQVGDLTMNLDDNAAGDVLYQMAQHYWHAGKWDAAAETFQLLTTRYPKHRLAGPALVWLLNYWSSGEVAWQIERADRQIAAASELPTMGFTAAPGQTPAAMQRASAQTLHVKRSIGLVRDTPTENDRLERASGIARQIEQQFAMLAAEPNVQFPFVAAQRKAGLPRHGDRLFGTITRTRAQDAWWTCAAGELWMADPSKAPSPKPMWRAMISPARPYLDGQLSDPVWQQAESAELRSPLGDDGEWPAEARAAYDAEYLYIAVRCRKAREADYPPSKGARPRDPDLSQRDRIELLIDLDRDYATFYRLTIDHRGWVADECWGARPWNPSWFVAAGGDEQTWTAEAAIPLDALTGAPPKSRDVWSVGVQRIVPGAGFQSWTTPASATTIPEGFGYFTFE
jgi:photosystem II stability/assembly factor-like uncharacterized protein